jgi:uncharacterized protein DUF1905
MGIPASRNCFRHVSSSSGLAANAMCFIPLTFDPKPVFGKVRAPVRVTLNGYTYRSTIAAMGGPPCIPLRKSNREAAGLQGGETITIRLDLDTDKREVKPPSDLLRALKAIPGAIQTVRPHLSSADTQPTLNPALCSLSPMISQYFIRSAKT